MKLRLTFNKSYTNI